jgi:hypothetical protein
MKVPHAPRTTARAVGHAITFAIQAGGSEHPESPESWVHFCVTAAEEAEDTISEADGVDLPSPTILKLDRMMDKTKWPDIPQFANSEEYERWRAVQRPAVNAKEAAAMAYKLCMPKLTGRRATQAYIACVAAGVQRGYFSGIEAKSLLYTAQLALSAYPSRSAKPKRR